MRIIVDITNVFSEVLNFNSKIEQILLNSKEHFPFYTADYLRAEIRRYQSKLQKLTTPGFAPKKWCLQALFNYIKLLPAPGVI